MTLWLDKHVKILYVSTFSKKWSNDELAKRRKVWAQAKKIYKKESRYKNELRQAWNTYYHIIKKAKKECWQNFLQGRDTTLGIHPENQNRC